MNNSTSWHTLTYREEFRLLFGALLFKIPYSDPEIPPFYSWGSQPLLSILKAMPTKRAIIIFMAKKSNKDCHEEIFITAHVSRLYLTI